jgi:O-antigen/teichoic acid export membrane protein
MRLREVVAGIKPGVADSSLWLRLRRNVSLSVLGSGLSLLSKLAQTALLTRILRIEDYGRLLIVLNLFVFLDSFFGMRVSDLMFRFFPSFKEHDQTALKGLLALCLTICLASALFIYGGVVVLSPWLANRLYPNLGLAPLFKIYGCTLLVSAFSGVSEPILRLHDRFVAIVLPQVLGSIATLALLGVYFATNKSFAAGGAYDLKAIVAAFAIGSLVQSVPPLVQALKLVRSFLTEVKANEAWRGLRQYRRELAGCFFHSNLSGYLKFAISPGDVFLLGLFSSPTQLAWYGLAKQLTAPLALLQTNIQTAVTPEISSLVARRKFVKLKSLLARYFTLTFKAGSVFLLAGFLFGYLLIGRAFPPQYLPALPIFYVLATASWLLLGFVVFRPLAVSLDLLRWHNFALLISAVLVVSFIVAGDLNALTLAYIQLFEVVVLRAIFNALIWSKLKRLAARE